MLRQKAHDAIYCSEVRNKTPLYAKYELAYPVFPGWPPLGTGVASVQILVRARDSSRTSHEGQKRPVFASVSTRIRKVRAATFCVRIGFHKEMQVQILCRMCQLHLCRLGHVQEVILVRPRPTALSIAGTVIPWSAERWPRAQWPSRSRQSTVPKAAGREARTRNLRQ